MKYLHTLGSSFADGVRDGLRPSVLVRDIAFVAISMTTAWALEFEIGDKMLLLVVLIGLYRKVVAAP